MWWSCAATPWCCDAAAAWKVPGSACVKVNARQPTHQTGSQQWTEILPNKHGCSCYCSLKAADSSDLLLRVLRSSTVRGSMICGHLTPPPDVSCGPLQKTQTFIFPLAAMLVETEKKHFVDKVLLFLCNVTVVFPLKCLGVDDVWNAPLSLYWLAARRKSWPLRPQTLWWWMICCWDCENIW